MVRAIITRKLAPAPETVSEPVFWAITYRDPELDTYAIRVTFQARETERAAAMLCYGRHPEPGMTFYNLGPDWTEAKKKLKSVPLVPG